jgi:isoamylase
LIALRQRFAENRQHESITLTEFLGRAQLQWHGVALNRPDWGDSSHSLALSAQNIAGQRIVYFIWNAYWEPLSFELPLLPAGSCWLRVVDTSIESPGDITVETPPCHKSDQYLAQPRSIVILTWSAAAINQPNEQ